MSNFFFHKMIYLLLSEDDCNENTNNIGHYKNIIIKSSLILAQFYGRLTNK